MWGRSHHGLSVTDGPCGPGATVVHVMEGRVAEARHLAESVLAGSGGRLQHVRRVGVLAEQLTVALSLGPQVAEAAWLHDVGYAGDVATTGFHPLDGATWLAARGWAPAARLPPCHRCATDSGPHRHDS